MAKYRPECWKLVTALGLAAVAGWAQAGVVGAAAPVVVPRVTGHLVASDLGLVVNTEDPYSVAVGEYYAEKRHLAPDQVLRVKLPVQPVLSPEAFASLQAEIGRRFGASTQALALAWREPYAVACNSITGALALGFDASLCQHTCSASKPSPYFNSASVRPYADLKLRPSMLLAAPDIATAKALIDRGVAADHSLVWRGAPTANVEFVATDDAARSVRAVLFPPPGKLPQWNVEVHVEHGGSLEDRERLLLYETGLAQVGHLDTLRWLDGALADHLTSFGGQLERTSGQTTAVDWIRSGATASYGTVSEPCNHLQKFPHPQVLLMHYLQGATALEAYWKSVAWPQQGVFVGEPLAAPFARR